MAYENKLDNSDVQLSKDSKEVVGGMFNSVSEAQTMKTYLETLKLTAEIKAKATEARGKTTDAERAKTGGAMLIKVEVPDGTTGKTKSEERLVFLDDLIPAESEFERARKVIIAKINGKTDSELRELMARFDSESTWDLSSKITNYVLDQRKRNSAYESWKNF